MARILFIRVSAATYDEKEVSAAWPVLYAAVWPDKNLAGVDSPAKLARRIVPAPGRGVLELADAFVEFARFEVLPESRASSLKAAAGKLEDLRHSLDEALGNRDVQQADALCSSIEDVLDSVEDLLRSTQ